MTPNMQLDENQLERWENYSSFIDENGEINLYENWNTTDENGFFKKPSKQTLLKLKSSREYYNDSLKNSLVEFVKVVKEQQLWTDDYFSKSIKSNRILLNERVSDD